MLGAINIELFDGFQPLNVQTSKTKMGLSFTMTISANQAKKLTEAAKFEIERRSEEERSRIAAEVTKTRELMEECLQQAKSGKTQLPISELSNHARDAISTAGIQIFEAKKDESKENRVRELIKKRVLNINRIESRIDKKINLLKFLPNLQQGEAQGLISFIEYYKKVGILGPGNQSQKLIKILKSLPQANNSGIDMVENEIHNIYELSEDALQLIRRHNISTPLTSLIKLPKSESGIRLSWDYDGENYEDAGNTYSEFCGPLLFWISKHSLALDEYFEEVIKAAANSAKKRCSIHLKFETPAWELINCDPGVRRPENLASTCSPYYIFSTLSSLGYKTESNIEQFPDGCLYNKHWKQIKGKTGKPYQIDIIW
jgi:hypothetical protein